VEIIYNMKTEVTFCSQEILHETTLVQTH